LGKDPIQWTTRLQTKNAAILSNFLLLLDDVFLCFGHLFFVCGDESAALIFFVGWLECEALLPIQIILIPPLL
jgi:hypothetical protein